MMIFKTVDQVEREHILAVLAHLKGNRSHACQPLGISLKTLRNKIARYKSEGHYVPASRASAKARRRGTYHSTTNFMQE